MAKNTSNYLQLLQSLLPKGKVWNRIIDSTLGQFLYGVAEEFARVDLRTEDLQVERDTRYANELLVDHEIDLGLPNECTVKASTLTERRQLVNGWLTSTGGQSAAYFIEIAERYGYTITITEFTPFWCGLGVAGDPCGEQDVLFHWRVNINIADGVLVYFTAGQSQAGDSLLKSSDVLESLICIFENVKPAHTVLSYLFVGPGFSRGFSSGFDSLLSDQESFLYGGFSRGFDFGFDRHNGGGFNTGFTVGFNTPA